MSTRESDRTVRLSILDRLAGGEAGGIGNRSAFDESVAELKHSLLRDLEWLLNTRQVIDRAPDELKELQRSVYNFGLRDITSKSSDSVAVRRELIRQMEECIQTFEPRLTSVRVTPIGGDDSSTRRIHFVIEGLLRMEPNPERVAFDTVLDIASGKIEIQGDQGA